MMLKNFYLQNEYIASKLSKLNIYDSDPSKLFESWRC